MVNQEQQPIALAMTRNEEERLWSSVISKTKSLVVFLDRYEVGDPDEDGGALPKRKAC